MTKLQNQSSKSYVAGKIVIKLKSSITNDKAYSLRQNLAGQLSATHSERIFPQVSAQASRNPFAADLANIYIFDLPADADIVSVSEALKKQPEIAYAEPVYYRYLNAIPNDPLFPSQWYLQAIKTPSGWDIAIGDTSVIIAIIDSGMDMNHPDLVDRLWVNPGEIPNNRVDDDGNGFIDDINGWDFFNRNNDPNPNPDGIDNDNNGRSDDSVDHGTGMAGFASATTNNAEGIAGVAWNCQLMPLQVFPDDGGAPTNLVAAAIQYAADKGAQVINLSLGSSTPSELEHDAIKYAFAAGSAIIAAAGNSDSIEPHYPAAFPEVLAVGATANLTDIKSSISNYGAYIDVCAPGGDFNIRPASEMITTAYHDPQFGFNQLYSARSKEGFLSAGTSSSAALVSGLAGLVWAHNPALTNAGIYFQITETADDIYPMNPDYLSLLGTGRVNTFRALTETVTPEPRLSLVSAIINDSLGGNGNGIPEPSESVQLIVTFKNEWADAANLTVSLRTEDYAIQLTQPVTQFQFIPGLSDLQNNVQDNSRSPFELKVIAGALPHRVKFSLDLSAGMGTFSTLELTLSIAPNVLLVDDDDNLNNVESYYISVLDSLGISFDLWNRNTQGPVGFSRLQNYPLVIWSCEWTFPSLDAEDRADLEFYLLSGGNLFLSGQDIGWDLNDPNPQVEHEFTRSNGSSKVFYETMIHASYLKDDSEFSSVVGIDGNPIGNGLRFNIRQPGRADTEQFPSEIIPLGEASSIFNYANGNSGAVLYSGDYRVVYFAFGGFEAIVEEPVRFEVLDRLLSWFGGITLEFNKLTDTENTTNAYPVDATVTSAKSPLTQVELYWDTDGAFPFQKLSMTDLGNGKYRAFIPAQKDAQIHYFVYARNDAGFYTPIRFQSFFAGADQKAPIITNATVIPDQLSNAGPFAVAFEASDNIRLDTSYAFVHFFSSGTLLDSASMNFQDKDFAGFIPGGFVFGDTVHYYFSSRDLSSRKNIGKSSVYSFRIGREGFENDLVNWVTDDSSGWVLDLLPHQGNYNLRWLPRQFKASNKTTFTLKDPISLANFTQAWLHYWYFHLTRPTDYVVVEASTDTGLTWNEVSARYSGVKIKSPADKYLEEFISLDQFIKSGIDKVWLRLNYVLGPGAPAQANGFYLDDIEILLLPDKVADDAELGQWPFDYALRQNYPNPFNASTRILYQLSIRSHVTITIFNTLGQEVHILVNEVQGPGTFAVAWNGLDRAGRMVPSGVYVYQIQAGNYTATRKLLLLK